MSSNKVYHMQKRGQAEIIGGIILLGVLLFGVIGTNTALNDNRYILDENSNLVYDLAKCNINNLNQSSLVIIKVTGDLNSKYKWAECTK